MIGRTIGTRARPRRAAFISLGLAALSASIGLLAKEPGVLLFAALPGSVGLAALVNWRRGFALTLSATGVRDDKGRTIPFTAIKEVRPLVPFGRPRGHEFPIEVRHAGGALVIPAFLTESSERLYDFLKKQVGPRTSVLPAALMTFAAEQRAQFGPERIFTFGGRATGTSSAHAPLDPYLWIGFSAAGLIWMLVPFATELGGTWVALGLLLFVVAAILLTHDLTYPGARPFPGPTPGLVIAPGGLAMQLGDLNGRLGWEEIVKITYPSKTPAVSMTRIQPGIAIEVAGARIVITDSFTHPLDEIHGRIVRNWRP